MALPNISKFGLGALTGFILAIVCVIIIGNTAPNWLPRGWFRMTSKTPESHIELDFGVSLAGHPIADHPSIDTEAGSELAPIKLPWMKKGSHPEDYDLGVDLHEVFKGKPSALIRPRGPNPQGYCSMLQIIEPGLYRGKRIRFAGYIKAAGVEDHASLVMRVNDPDYQPVSFGRKEVNGTADWAQHVVVLDVPEDTANIVIAFSLSGAGQAWINGLTFEEVGFDVPTTLGEDVMRHPALDFGI